MTILIDNLDEVEAWKGGEGGLPIPKGKHIAKVEAVEETPANTGSPQLIITWAGPDDTSSREWLVILPQTYGKVKALLQALKWELQPGQFEMPTHQLVGRSCWIVVGEETWNNKTSTRVLGHSPIEDGDLPIDTTGLPAPAVAGAPLPF